MGFFSNIGDAAASLSQKLGSSLSGVTDWLSSVGPEVLSVAQQVKELEALGRPARSDKGSAQPGYPAPAAPAPDASPTTAGVPMVALVGAGVLAVVLLARRR